MSGLMFAGMALGGIHIANAQNNVNSEIDNSRYTVMIPSEVTIDKESGKGSFAVTGKVDAQTELDVSVSSQNGYKLKNKNQEISYSLDKDSFYINNIKSADMKSFDENFNITLANTNTNYSGNYEDRLTFNIGSNKYTYELDMNSILDGVRKNEHHNYGAAGVYINGVLKAENVSDFREILNYGDTYEFKNIKATDGHHFVGINSCANTSIKGRIGADTNYLETRRDNPYNLVAPIYFEFNTNKLTINYHADGAQTWHHFDNITYDVSGKDIAASETRLFGSYYDGKSGLGDVSRLTKKGYTAKPNTWIVGKNGTKEVIDSTGLTKSQDVAEYCGVLDEFKKNDMTIDLYPIWTPNTYTLTYDLNGGSFNASTTQRFKYESEDAISSEIPIKTGYVFTGWKWGDVTMQPGDTIPKECGNFTLTAQWEKVSYSAGTILNIEGNDYIVMGQTEDGNYRLISGTNIGNMQYQPNVDSDGNYKVGTYETPDDKRPDGQYSNTYEGSYIDNYLENTWYKQLPDKLQKAIQVTDIKQASYMDFASNPKWKYFDPNGGSSNDWYYNEGTTENPKWVVYYKVNFPEDAQGAHPLNCWKYSEKGYNNTTYNAISRHVFLPSVEEVSNLVDLNNANKVYDFLKGTNNSLYHMWFRDGYTGSPRSAMYLSYSFRSMNKDLITDAGIGARPAFVINLSKVNYIVTGSVNYK